MPAQPRTPQQPTAERFPRSAVWLMGTGFVGLAGLFLFSQLISTVEHSSRPVGGDVRAVEVRVDVGKVTVNVTEEDTARASLRSTFTSGLRPPAEAVEQVRDTLRVNANCGRLTGDCSTDYELTVPAETRVTVRTAHGHVSAKGLRASVAARVEVGDVRMIDVRGRTITARSQTGNVTLSDVRFRTADTATERGQIRVVSTSGFTRLRALNHTGDVVLTLPRRSGPYAVEARGGTGRRTVDVERDAGAPATVQASTSEGDVTITGD
ncbi:DUF4097 domain-containing protein [Streptomyces sp. P38-E01]|uniref:DUF4097 domain-containing protein n=1 Tax=Streptomyces tardus TaxID=2780544 RepID=A0A949JE89_9ACTN|nr:DUF4097 family beta strand repeat-containing protein [Streptomyces tardus]MBU7598442.1 DUF4097 domain-containing protein [Streptomyces tardus]